MIIDMNVQVDLKEWQDRLNQYPDQIAYAFSTAVNKTIMAAQNDIREHEQTIFHVRRESYVKRSIKITQFATKKDQTATVAVSPPGGAPDVISKFEEGGTKTPTTAAHVAIPEEAVQPDINKVIGKAKRPRNIKGSFILKVGDREYIAWHDKRKSKVLKFGYRLVDSVQIKPILNFVSIATEVVKREWDKQFSEAWKRAVETRK